MADGKRYEFKIPNPRGLDAKVPTKMKDFSQRLWNGKPTDANQMAPDEEMPVRQHAYMAGNC